MNRTNILEYLEHTAGRFRYRTAVECNDEELTWDELAVMARRIGSGISRRVRTGSPVPVMMEKSPLMLAVMLGAVYAGCFYVPVNPDNPPERLMKIFHLLEPEILVTDRKTAELSGREDIRVFAEDLVKEDADPARLAKIREQSGETDILYGIFTSGSTGTPKAVAVSHGAVIRFIRHFTEIFGITAGDVIGNQAPFDFDVSVKDIYSSLMTGAKLVLIPKEYFATPPRLLDYLCEKKVTSLTWAVSALTLISSLKGLRYRVPDRVNKVMFSGEAMPPKQLKLWREALPHTHFYNLYGPTEITCNCTYYPVVWDYEEGEKIPIGKAFPGRTVFLLDEEDLEIADPGRQGEICVAGESLARGYYRDEEILVYLFRHVSGRRRPATAHIPDRGPGILRRERTAYVCREKGFSDQAYGAPDRTGRDRECDECGAGCAEKLLRLPGEEEPHRRFLYGRCRTRGSAQGSER